MNTTTRKAIAILVAIFVVGIGGAVYAQEASNYDYAVTLTVQNNSGGALTDALVPFDINVNELQNDGYLAADGQDILVLSQSGGSEALAIAQDTTTDPGRWWVHVDSLDDSNSKSFTLYMGQNTTAADNPQHFIVTNAATTTNDITYTHPGGVVQAASFVIDDFMLYTLPSATSPIGASGGGYSIVLSAGGVLTAEYTDGVTSCIVTATLSVDTEYDIETGGSNLNDFCYITVDGATVSTDNTAIASSLSGGGGTPTGTFGGVADGVFSMGRWRHYFAGAFPLPPVIDYQFELPHMTETQEGNAGNLWTWQGTIDDQQGGDQDATYTIVQDTSNLTLTVGPVMAQTAAAAGGVTETDPTFVSGTVTGPVDAPYTEGSAASDFGFPFNIIAGSAVTGSIPLMLLAGTIVAVLSILAGFGAFKLTRMPGAGTLAAMVVGGALVYLTPMPNVSIILLVITLGMATILIDRPLEARP